MGAWGLGLFQSDYDYEVVDQLASEAGLRCSSSQQLLHPKDPDQVRRHLNSGILSALITKYMAIHSAHPSLRESKQDFATPSYKLVIIGALAMQLGCHLSKEFKAWLGGNYGKVGLMRDATKQMMEGLAVYENGKPHDFRSLGLNDTLAMDGPAAKDRIVPHMINVPSPPFGDSPIGYVRFPEAELRSRRDARSASHTHSAHHQEDQG